MTEIILDNTPVKEKNTRAIEVTSVTRYVHRSTGVVHYVFQRRSKKKKSDEPNYYDIEVDERECTTGPCQCYDYVNYRTTLIPIGQCGHQKALVEQMMEKRRLAWTAFAKELERGVL